MNSLIFLMCSERSGSNLITRMFDSHPQVCGPGTAHLADSLLPELHRYEPLDVNWPALIDDLLELLAVKNAIWAREFSRQELFAAASRGHVAALLAYVYLEEARANGKDLAFVKENRIHEFSALLLSAYPLARYVYLCRDPRDMAASWKGGIAMRGGVVRGAKTWLHDQLGFKRMMAALPRGTRIGSARYEDLVRDPERTLRQLCGSIDLIYHPAMPRHHLAETAQRNAAMAADYANIDKPVFSGSVGSFRERLSHDEIRYVEAVCEGSMKELGYLPEFPILAPEEFQEVAARLADVEPMEKPSFQSIAADELDRRSRFMHIRSRIRNRRGVNA